MIDPKLDKVPAKSADDLEDLPESDLTQEQGAGGARRPRTGLSINDTIARDANLSVGSRGVDTSGVVSGAGAGAGMTNVTPGEQGGSPAPNIVPGGRSSGTTPRGSTGVDQTATTRLEGGAGPTDDEIATRAYRCWHERGCPAGSPEVDWERAEQELRSERGNKAFSATSSR